MTDGSRRPLSSSRALLSLLVAACCAFVPAAQARSHKHSPLADAIASALEPGSTTVPATGQVEFAFSPRQGAEALVLKVIGASRREIRMLAYALTSAPVVDALIAAKKRGVDVQVLVDFKENISADRSGKAHAALGALAAAGIPVRTIDVFAIHHDKVLVVDAATVQTGSFNYTQAAARSNSENAIVLWNNPALARGYLAHWEHNWRMGRPFQPAY
jgi:phosphatidylserine/phosphatidylglycerophosphate/cardiolipin synthase-like enzyme